eukprot:scaffold27772_cov59-Phaeocystis_antarctica.AAC.1
MSSMTRFSHPPLPVQGFSIFMNTAVSVFTADTGSGRTREGAEHRAVARPVHPQAACIGTTADEESHLGGSGRHNQEIARGVPTLVVPSDFEDVAVAATWIHAGVAAAGCSRKWPHVDPVVRPTAATARCKRRGARPAVRAPVRRQMRAVECKIWATRAGQRRGARRCQRRQRRCQWREDQTGADAFGRVLPKGRAAASGGHSRLDLIGVRRVESSNGVDACNSVAPPGQAGRAFIWPVPVGVAAHLPHGLRRVELRAVAGGASAVAELSPLVVMRRDLGQRALAHSVVDEVTMRLTTVGRRSFPQP